MSFTFDSNILVYALDKLEGAKHRRARQLVEDSLDRDVILTAQSLGEFLNVFLRKKSDQYEVARTQADRFSTIFAIVATLEAHMLRGADFARRHKLQFWDSVIWQVAASAGATILISEDLQDGLLLDGMMVVDPFNSANDELISLLLATLPGEE